MPKWWSARPGPTLEAVQYLDTFQGGNLPEDKQSVHFSMVFRHPERTLTGEEVERAVKSVVEACEAAVPGQAAYLSRHRHVRSEVAEGGRGEPAQAMAIVGPGPAAGRAGAGLHGPGHALALGARLGGLHGRDDALGARRGAFSRSWRPAGPRPSRPLLPPLDWDSPQTFSPLDRDAWKLVQDEAEQGRDACRSTPCSEATRTSTPDASFSSAWPPTIIRSTTDPLDDVPLVELLTALELAAEDLVAALPPDPRRRPDLALALAEGRPGRRLHLPRPTTCTPSCCRS